VKSYNLEAFVLRMRPLGEADRIVTLFSRERGKGHAVAKGVRKPHSKFGARLDFFSRVQLSLHTGRSLDVITAAHTVTSSWESVIDPERFAAASYVGEIVDALCEPDLAVEELYDTVCQFQQGLCDKQTDPELLIAAFDLRLLQALGVTPELDACARCGTGLGNRPLAGGRAALSAHAGGLLCRSCSRQLTESERYADERSGVFSIKASEFKALRALREATLGDSASLTSASAGCSPSSLHRATRPFIEYQLGRRSKSLTVAGNQEQALRTSKAG
jgi:DNA repair protein RecO (recombination protein O)